MNLHLALKTIWNVETDAGLRRLRLKHFKPKKTKLFVLSCLPLSTHKHKLYTPANNEKISNV